MQQLIPAYIQQQLLAGQLNGRITAFTLNIDLSGFTALTEDLMKQGSQGAEKMSVILNEIFEPLVALVYRNGGFIPYFAGDAFTAVFPLPPDTSHAIHLLHTADEARRIFRERDNPFGGQFTIGIKAGIAQGNVEFGIVGDELKAFYFRGAAIDSAADCQSLAKDQDIVIDQMMNLLISDRPITTVEVTTNSFLLLGPIDGEKTTVKSLNLPVIDADIAQSFLPAVVVNNEQSGEFRTVISCFLAFENLTNHEELSALADITLDHSLNFGAYFKEVDFGDKGGLMAIFFGAPISYENAVIRALEFALTVREECNELQKTHPDFQFRMGLTMGTAFTGMVGGKERCQYACVGNRVNLAARIMSSANWGEILLDEELAQANAFECKPKGKTKYKGISTATSTFSLIGRMQNVGKPTYEGPMIAREEECGRLLKFTNQVLNSETGGLVYVYGEAGIGKSRTTHELRRQLKQKHPRLSWQLCPCDQILKKPSNA